MTIWYQLLQKFHVVIPHGKSDLSANENISGTWIYFSSLGSLGRRVYTRPPFSKSHKLYNRSTMKKLGCTSTGSQIYYWCLETNFVRTLNCVIFDKGMNDLEDPINNYKQPIISLDWIFTEDPEEATTPLPPSFDAQYGSFLYIQDITVKLKI